MFASVVTRVAAGTVPRPFYCVPCAGRKSLRPLQCFCKYLSSWIKITMSREGRNVDRPETDQLVLVGAFVAEDCNPCNTLQHTATHCSTLQHTASHCSKRRMTFSWVGARSFYIFFDNTFRAVIQCLISWVTKFWCLNSRGVFTQVDVDTHLWWSTCVCERESGKNPKNPKFWCLNSKGVFTQVDVNSHIHTHK